MRDYSFKTTTVVSVVLSDLFGVRDDLMVIHNMGADCNHCTLWADGFTSYLPHIEDRAAFVVISPDSPDMQRAFQASRGWNFRMVSAVGRDFVDDMGYVVDG